MTKILKNAVVSIAFIVLMGFSILGALFIFDRVYLPRSIEPKAGPAFDLYPYTGWHVQANRLFTDMPWEKQPYHDFDVKTGSMGFFVDFDMTKPPVKKPNEFRIILIGGSGAQGWGGRTNQDMLYKKLEMKLNELYKGKNVYFRVINLAMAGSVTYQNFIALNMWGHNLQPDLILSYSGRNDIWVPIYHNNRADVFYDFDKLNAYVLAQDGSVKPPPQLRSFYRLFPNIFKETSLGSLVKLYFSEYYEREADFYYKRNTDLGKYTDYYYLNSHTDIATRIMPFFYDIVVPMYVSSLKSIKRDFCGIPIVVAWQAVRSEEEAMYYFKAKGVVEKIGLTFGPYYNEMFDRSSAALSGYFNDKWHFINVHKIFENDPRPYIGTHLGNEGHELVADIIAKELYEFIRDYKLDDIKARAVSCN